MAKFNILVVPSDTHGGVGFYRSTQPHIQLEKQFSDEFSVTFNTKPQWSDLASFDKYQLIHVHKGLFEDMTAFRNAISYCRGKGIVTVMDIDDYWELDFRHPQHLTQTVYKLDKIIKDNLKLFDYVTTTTKLFANEIKKYNKNVFVIPNAIDPDDEHFKIEKKPSERLRIGLIMGSTHEKDLELIGKITESLSKEELDKVQFVLCGFDLRGDRVIYDQLTGKKHTEAIKPKENIWYRYEKIVTSDYKIIDENYRQFLESFLTNIEYPNVDNMPYKRRWTLPMDKYYQHYSHVDVLLAPLETSMFNKVKSPLKVAECAFSHTAIVASEFGPYTEDLKNAFQKGGTIDEKGNALLVDVTKNGKNWLRFIKMLIAKPELVKQLQDNLYNDVHEKYDLKNVTEKRAKIYKELIEKTKKA